MGSERRLKLLLKTRSENQLWTSVFCALLPSLINNWLCNEAAQCGRSLLLAHLSVLLLGSFAPRVSSHSPRNLSKSNLDSHQSWADASTCQPCLCFKAKYHRTPSKTEVPEIILLSHFDQELNQRPKEGS